MHNKWHKESQGIRQHNATINGVWLVKLLILHKAPLNCSIPTALRELCCLLNIYDGRKGHICSASPPQYNTVTMNVVPSASNIRSDCPFSTSPAILLAWSLPRVQARSLVLFCRCKCHPPQPSNTLSLTNINSRNVDVFSFLWMNKLKLLTYVRFQIIFRPLIIYSEIRLSESVAWQKQKSYPKVTLLNGVRCNTILATLICYSSNRNFVS